MPAQPPANRRPTQSKRTLRVRGPGTRNTAAQGARAKGKRPQGSAAQGKHVSARPPAARAGARAGARAPSRAPSRPPPVAYRPPPLRADIARFLRRYGHALAAAGTLVLGLALLLTLPGAGAAWIERIFGWTGLFVALLLVVVGAVGLLGRRAGYWSAEALVGAELLLLCLAAGTYAANRPVNRFQPLEGENGGITGWVLGGWLLDTLGRPMALILLVLVSAVGLLLLVRYTPLLYVAAALARALPRLGRRAQALLVRWTEPPAARKAAARPAAPSPPPAANFVAPDPAPRTPIRIDPAQFDPPRHAPTPLEAAAAGTPEEPAPALPAPSPAPAAGRPRVRPAPLDDSLPPLRPATGKPARGAKTPRPDKAAVVAAAAPLPAAPLPSLDLLAGDSGLYSGGDVEHYQQLIEWTLADFETPVRVVHVESGPTVTQFGVEPLYIERAGQKRKVRVSRIVALENDLALALAVPAVRIEAPVPGRPYVGIEVPNVQKSLVSLRGILEAPEFARQGGALALPLGRNTAGAPVVMDLTRAPHLLIAGATGSGKSVSINTIVAGLLMRHGPESLRLVMIDPKRVELTGYNGIPHLLGHVITDVDEVMPALTWLLLEMDNRYRLFGEQNVRNIDAYNALARAGRKGSGADAAPPAPLPYLVLIVDELADLMMTAPEDIERQLCRLAQKARATGIHLILATQRPSVDVVTGLIKANFPTRIAFAVTSGVDSRVILDGPGAERLLGRGDMLLMRPDLAKLLRVQGCLVTDDEIERVVRYWVRYGKEQAAFTEGGDAPARAPWAAFVGRDEEADELLQQAIDLLDGMQTCTVSLLQRRLRLGHPRAARLMEQLEAQGIVGPDGGAGQGRAVLLNRPAETGTIEYDAGRPPAAFG